LDLVRDGVLYYFSERMVIPTDVVLVFSKFDEVINCLFIVKKDYGHDCIFVIILWGV